MSPKVAPITAPMRRFADRRPSTKKPAMRPENTPTIGVLPILLHKLCGEPATMMVIRERAYSLQYGPLKRKTDFAKTRAYYNGSAGVDFVVDTEGAHPERKRTELKACRDQKLPDFPMAVGVAPLHQNLVINRIPKRSTKE